MEWKILATVFVSVFIAEMADKTQLVTMLFAADREVSKWTVFLRRIHRDRQLDVISWDLPGPVRNWGQCIRSFPGTFSSWVQNCQILLD
jgi:hypothetical protein